MTADGSPRGAAPSWHDLTKEDYDALVADRDALRGKGPRYWEQECERLRADRDALRDETEDAVSEIGEYSEGCAPTDLRGAVEWLIREETKSRVDRDALQERAENAEKEADQWFQQHQALAHDDYIGATARENESLRAERDSARRERGRYLTALQRIAASPQRAQKVAREALAVELGESKP